MGKKWNRRAMTLGLGAAAALLTGCFASDGLVTEEADLVFRNDSGAAVSSVQLSGASESQGASLADGSPLERGETLGFWVEHPGPVTVEAFDPEGRSIGWCRGTLGKAQVTVTLEGGRLVWTEAN